MSKRVVAMIVGALLSIQAGLLIHSAKVHSPTWDEVGHLAAGLSHWEFGRFELYSVNPPLVRTLAAAPVHFFCEPEMDWDYYRSDPSLRSEVYLGRRMMDLSGPDSLAFFFWARLCLVPIALIGGWLCFAWSRALFGEAAGLLSLSIWTFSPNVLGYGALITPDLSCAVACLACGFAFWHWLQQPTWIAGFYLSLALAFAMLTKSVWLLLPPTYAVIWIAYCCFRRSYRSTADARNGIGLSLFSEGAILFSAVVLAVVLVNAFYGFQGSFKSLGSYSFHSSALSGSPLDRSEGEANILIASRPSQAALGVNRFAGGVMASLPVALPMNYLQGIDIQMQDFERGWYDPSWQSYLFGTWKQGGWWYYYLVAILVKVPLSIFGLLLLSLFTCWRWQLSRSDKLGLICLVVPCLVFFVVLSSSTGLNRYMRYALTVLPVLFVVAAGALPRSMFDGKRSKRDRLWLVTVLGLVACLVITSALHSKSHLSYFNSLAGGPSKGHRILCDSNIDWGQDLIRLRDWVEGHPDARQDLRLAYFGSFDPASIGIRYSLPPIGPRYRMDSQIGIGKTEAGLDPGWYVISKNYLVGHPMPVPDGRQQVRFPFVGAEAFSYFQNLAPVGEIGNSMNIYHVETYVSNEVVADCCDARDIKYDGTARDGVSLAKAKYRKSTKASVDSTEAAGVIHE